MRLPKFLLALAAIAVVAVAFNGCSKPSAAPGSSTSGSGDAGNHEEQNHEHGDHEHDDHEHGSKDSKTAMEQMAEGLANLSDADRASAEKQHICPVTGDMLGTMGEPIKVNVKGQDVWICCDGCEEPLLEDPDKYLALLKK